MQLQADPGVQLIPQQLQSMLILIYLQISVEEVQQFATIHLREHLLQQEVEVLVPTPICGIRIVPLQDGHYQPTTLGI